MIKKFICTTLAAVMLLVMTPVAVSADPGDPIPPFFEDPRAVIPAPCDYDVE